ncbi:MAG TPA: cobyrinate a,c-diamide synthase [Nitrospirae bacterium]|nr:cobyrinate a,c-diamide synthase [Nitrospirota bacterium]
MHIKSIPRIVISGLRGGSGKTILSLCLIASLRKDGFKITPFKKGPDYIDAGWLAQAAGSPCYNLDLFMMAPGRIKRSFISHAENSQIAVIEGNRGLFDGADHKGTFSTAQIAKLLKTPVILVIDCTKATNTVAAMVLGCQKMDPKVSIAGVVLNRVATGRQETLIRKAISDRCKLPVLGAIPRLENDLFPERHMGLTPFQEHPGIKRSLSAVKKIASKYLDVNGIMKIAKKAGTIKAVVSSQSSVVSRDRQRTTDIGLRIGIIKDSAFQFYYPENFEELERRGAELIAVSPLREKKLPDMDALYIGGGFPETHAIELSQNAGFRRSLCSAVEKGLPVYAECGGLMYLGKSLVLKNRKYPMAGVFPIVFELEKKMQAHGYTIVKVAGPNPYFPEGSILKGHEFHYSRVAEFKKGRTHMAFNMRRGKGIKNSMDGICYKNVLATYTHLHALGSPKWVDGMIKCAKRYKKTKVNL